MPNSDRSVLLAGSFGFGNTGDDAILAAMIDSLRAKAKLDIVVACGDPATVLEAQPGVGVVHWQDVTGLVDAARRCDVIVLGGGGLFYDYWGFDPASLLTQHHTELAYYTGFAVLAAIADKPLMIYAAGAGPLQSDAGRAFARAVFEQASVVTVRDPLSKAVVESLGIDAASVRVTADPAFALRAASREEAIAIVEAAARAPVRHPLVGVALRNWDIGVDPHSWEHEVAKALDGFLARHEALAVFVPFQSIQGILTDDRAVAQRVIGLMQHKARAILLDQHVAPAAKSAVLGLCDIVLGMRLHSLIFAIGQGTPVVALPYDPKVSGVNSLTSVKGGEIPLGRMRASELDDCLDRAYASRREIGWQLAADARRLAEHARLNADLALQLIDAPVRRPLRPAMSRLVRELAMQQSTRVHALQTALRATSEAQPAANFAQPLVGGTHEAAIHERDCTIAALSAELALINQSRGFRIVRRLWRVRAALRPSGVRKRVASEDRRAIAPLAVGANPPAQMTHDRVVTAPAVRTGAPRVAYLTNRVVDPASREPCFGGGERYCMTLAAFLRERGFDVTIFQAGPDAFEARRDGFRIVSLPYAPGYSEFQSGVCDAFHEASAGFDRVIHNLPEFASGRVRDDAVVICHGIWFDHDNYGAAVSFRTPEWYEHLRRVFSQPAKVVSVDTNSINVVRALWPDLARKMTYVPNWVDLDVFHPADSARDSRIVLFPRRSQVNRGSRMLEDILRRIPHAWRFLWVGEGDQEDAALLCDLARRDPRFEFRTATFAQMPDFFRQAEICVIPTIAAEGTSLACLEAMATGIPVVATNVGGLGNLVQPGLNGMLVDPEAGSIAAAINLLIENASERRRLGAAGRSTASGFGLDAWKSRWTTLLDQLGWLSPAGTATHA